jgi:S1-C subfamily serine protease
VSRRRAAAPLAGAAVSRRQAAVALASAAALAGAGCGGDGQPAATPPALLAVSVPASPGRPGDVATAFAAGDGRAITVAHAVGRGRAVLAARPGGRVRRVAVARADARLDLAVLAVPGLKAPALRTARARAGERVRVLVVRDGGSRSLRATVRRPITARVRDRPGGTPRTRPALELAAAVMQGDSGAPVVDRDGRVVGMVFAQAADRDDLAYALDAGAVRIATR